jgi:predicted xylose isomerase-like sugar epimerase
MDDKLIAEEKMKKDIKVDYKKVNEFLHGLIKKSKFIDASAVRKNARGSIRIVTLQKVFKVWHDTFKEELNKA